MFRELGDPSLSDYADLEAKYNRLSQDAYKFRASLVELGLNGLENDSQVVARVEAELREAGLFDEDSDYGGAIGKSVLQLTKLLALQGHSGYSAATTIGIFNELASGGTLKPPN